MSSTLVHLFDQILEGQDIPQPKSVVRLAIDRAMVQIPAMPYSLATNLAHTVLWQSFWLNKLKGGRRNSSMKEWSVDFREPEASEIPDLKEAFIDGIREARELADQLANGQSQIAAEEAEETLIKIAIHAAYHMGQMNLLRRAASKSKD